MSINIGINGFGRIGRMVLRAGINNPNIRFVAINDLVPAENLAYLIKYDSTHGRFPGNVETDGNNILIDGKVSNVFQREIRNNWAGEIKGLIM